MKKDLQEFLYVKYPKLFRQKDLDKSKTLMCWGICVEAGHFKLIDEMCGEIQIYCDKNDIQAEFVQIKEKFGLLRVYIDEDIEEVYKIISKYETQSKNICQWCGATEGVVRAPGNWLRYLCEPCGKTIADHGNWWNKPDVKDQLGAEVEERRVNNVR